MTVEKLLGKDWVTENAFGQSFMQGLDVPTQRYQAIEFVEKRTANLAENETAVMQWSVAKHLELVPHDEEHTAATHRD